MLELVDKKDVKSNGKLVEHHTKYKEIHGEDKTIFMSFGDHISLHRKLRSQKKCKVPIEELNKISTNAYCRTDKYLEKHSNKGYCYNKKCYRCDKFKICLIANLAVEKR